MTTRRASAVLAWSLCGMWFVLAALTVWMSRGSKLEDDSGFLVALLGYLTVGALVISRHPKNAVGWLLMATAFTVLFQNFGEAYVYQRTNPGYLAVAVVTGSLFNIWFLLIACLLPLVFPDGHLLSPRWRPVLWFNLALTATTALGVALTPGELAVYANIDNPIHVHGAALAVVEALGAASAFLLMIAILLTALSLVLRFRGSRGRERQQVKWFAFAGLMTAGGLLLAALGDLLPPPWGRPSAGWDGRSSCPSPSSASPSPRASRSSSTTSTTSTWSSTAPWSTAP